MSTIPAGPGLSTNVLHPLHDAHSIQHAVAMVLTGLAGGRIHPKVAGSMLYGLRIAAANLRRGQ
jgi:hypothetical protein